MKSAVLIAGASLLLVGVEGALAASNPQYTDVASSFDGEGTLPLNDLHHHHHHHDDDCGCQESHHGHHHHHHGHHHHGHHHGHHHHHHEKPACGGDPVSVKTIHECVTVMAPPCTVTKTCTAMSRCTAMNTCTVRVSDPTTITKNKVCTVTSFADPVTITKSKVCTSTVVKSRTITKCFDHTKTQTEFFPKYTTKTATVTVDDPKTTTKTATVTVDDPKTTTKTATVTVDNPRYTTKTATITVDNPSTTTVTVSSDPDYTSVNTKPCATKSYGTKAWPKPSMTCTPAPYKPCCMASQQHVVEEGEDFFDIAALYNTTISTLFQDNAFLDEDSQLYAGYVLCVPSVEEEDYWMEKRDTAHHHHHHDVSCEEEPQHPTCESHKHHHHHKKHGKKHGHKKHHHHHHKHYQSTVTATCTTTSTNTKTKTKTMTQTAIMTPHPVMGGDDDASIHCGICHAWHNVWPGDTTSSIAARYEVSHGEIIHLNPWIGHGDNLREGDWVCIAGCDVPIRFELSHDDFDEDEDCAPEHTCVPCARPGVCPRSGKHAACPENHSCEKKA